MTDMGQAKANGIVVVVQAAGGRGCYVDTGERGGGP